MLDQFGSNVTSEDFVDVRRSAGLREDEDIRANDFLLAMMLRLGRIAEEDMVKARRLFAKLDREANGVLNDEDIAALLADRPDTENLCNKTFDPHASVDQAASPRANSQAGGGGSASRGGGSGETTTTTTANPTTAAASGAAAAPQMKKGGMSLGDRAADSSKQNGGGGDGGGGGNAKRVWAQLLHGCPRTSSPTVHTVCPCSFACTFSRGNDPADVCRVPVLAFVRAITTRCSTSAYGMHT